MATYHATCVPSISSLCQGPYNTSLCAYHGLCLLSKKEALKMIYVTRVLLKRFFVSKFRDVSTAFA